MTAGKPSMCCVRVSAGDFARTRPCRNAGTIERNGKHYCSRHDPVQVKLRRDSASKDSKRLQRVRLEARAPAMKALLVAIKDRCPGVHLTDQALGKTFADAIDSLLERT